VKNEWGDSCRARTFRLTVPTGLTTESDGLLCYMVNAHSLSGNAEVFMRQWSSGFLQG
jgi:hypothetical protein